MVRFYAIYLYLKPYLSIIPFHESEWRRRHAQKKRRSHGNIESHTVRNISSYSLPHCSHPFVPITHKSKPKHPPPFAPYAFKPFRDHSPNLSNLIIPISVAENDSADGVPSTSTDGARATNEIRKRFRVRDNLPLQH